MTILVLRYLAIAIPWAGFGSYAIMIVRGEDSANRVSWALWALGPAAAWAAERGSGISAYTAAATLVFGAGPVLVLAATFSRPYPWRPGRLDLCCGALGLVALGAWYGIHRAALAVWLAIAADAVAAAPTAVDFARSRPGGRAAVTYLASGTGAVITLWLQRGRWTLAGCAFPCYVAAVCTLISALALAPRRERPAWRQLRRDAALW